jgi:glycosyltransferase involved in cell wall biosynthesis
MGKFAGFNLPRNILILSTDDWDRPLWTNKQQIASRLSSDFNIIYVESLATIGRRQRKIGIGSVRAEAGGVTVYRPPSTLPFGQKIWTINRLNIAFIAPGVRRLLEERKFVDPILWCYMPNGQPFLPRLPHVLSCYDCVDEFSAFPGAWAGATQRMERRLLKSVDVVFTTARSLYESKSPHNPRTHFVSNSADFDLFHQAATAVPPPEVAALPKPVIGFVGGINYKIDADFMARLFRLRPGWSFVFVGPDFGMFEKCLAGHANAHFWGKRDAAELPAIMSGFDVCMIPYVINRYTDGVLPLKFFEYLATGKPVITTPMSELKRFQPLIDIAATPEEFAAAVERRLAADPDGDARIALAKENSWDHRINQILTILEKTYQEKREGRP